MIRTLLFLANTDKASTIAADIRKTNNITVTTEPVGDRVGLYTRGISEETKAAIQNRYKAS